MSLKNSQLNSSRVLLTKLRGGDYAHAGDEEAIEIVLQKALSFDSSLKGKAVLDVGSGFGGTADYFYRHGFKTIDGIDKDQAAIAYAKEKYPLINFRVGDALEVNKIFPAAQFSLIYLFNVIYAIRDKRALLKALAKIAKPGSLLVIFDYAHTQTTPESSLKDLAGKPMYPIERESLKRNLAEEGWEVLEVTDMTSCYMTWYKDLLKKLSEQGPVLRQEFSEEDMLKVETTFTSLLSQLESGTLGSVTIYARKREK